MKIFISGSRNINKLPKQVEEKLNDIIDNRHQVLVGDATGVDKLVRDYLQQNQYSNVSVYYTGQPRTQIPPQWNQVNVPPQKGVTGRDHFTLKDIEMTKDCDIAFAIHDGKSKGTQANIDRTVAMGKTTIVFNAETQKFLSSNVQPKSKIKTLEYQHPFAEKPEQLRLTVAQYMPYGKGIDSLGKLAIEATSLDGEPYTRITTNVTGQLFGNNIILPKNTAIIDTNNNTSIETALKKAKLAQPYLTPQGTPITVSSGFCQYPVYKFDEKELRQYDPKGYDEYSKDYDKKTEELKQQGYQTLDDIFNRTQSTKPRTRPLPTYSDENPNNQQDLQLD